ncbi:MAG: class I SAM-dependent methyltransferase [Candidatus Dormibacteria bacterium]
MTDPYTDETFAWWHLSEVSPELHSAVDQGWLPSQGMVLDVGCGLGTEVGWLVERGFVGVGIDLSVAAVTRAQAQHPRALFLPADVRHLPFLDRSFDIVLDRGCFHYLAPADRGQYEREVGRVLRPQGRLLLRACLNAAGARNDISEELLRATFTGWSIHSMERTAIPSDTRNLEALVVRLARS